MRGVGLLCALLTLALVSLPVGGHENQPGSLTLYPLEQSGGDASESPEWRLVFRMPLVFGKRHPARLALPDTWREKAPRRLERRPDAILEHVTVTTGMNGLPVGTIRFPGLEKTVTDVFVRVMVADGESTTMIARPAAPSVTLQARPGWAAAQVEYLGQGIRHIMLGVDHLLFVFGLLLLARGWRSLVKTVTAFTLAHSITLALATLGYASVPLPPLNAAIALSILFLAPEIIRARRGGTSFTIRRPWVVAFLFGLLHGFGFASGLVELGIPRAELPWALLMFNVGVELGQLAFVLLVFLAYRAMRVLEFRVAGSLALAPAYLVGSLGAYWTLDRIWIMSEQLGGWA